VAQRQAAEADNTRLAAEAARAAAAEELSRLKSEFIAIASHELRTPLSTILGFSEIILDQLEDGNQHREFLTIIHDDAVQLGRLVDNLLDVSRIESGRTELQTESIDLSQTVPALLAGLSAMSSTHVVTHDIEPGSQWVLADRGKLDQIFGNLVSNAIKYSPAGGQVRVRGVRWPEGPGMLLLSVSDTGVGIPPDQIEKVFDRFHRVDSSETRGIRGTGLGLYIVKRLVELHGGNIRVESEVGNGTTVSFTLPLDGSKTQQVGELIHHEAMQVTSIVFSPAPA
jgi:signal transduction histidine kinase